MDRFLFLLVFFFSGVIFCGEYKGFIKTQGKILIDSEGREFIIKGINLGNWLLPEGYMWQFSSTKADRPRHIEELIFDLIGEEKSKIFWKNYRDKYITEKDIRRIAEIGFNTVRVPLNYRLFMSGDSTNFLEEGFLYLDKLIEWCRKYNLFLIIDLHAAPGGQTGANIDDSKNDKAELFYNEFYQQMTIIFWKKIAQHCKDLREVLAYDLLNEPLPDKPENRKFFTQLEPLYIKITKAIREVDTNHIITIEGANWASDFSVFSKPFDSNLLYQFHKYWNKNDYEAIKSFVEFREKYNVPIWCGESGENNNQWYYDNFRLLEKYKIGWSFWTWKKLYSFNNPYSINIPAGWGKIINYARYKNHKPSVEESEAILSNFIENLSLEKCEYNEDVIKAIFGE